MFGIRTLPGSRPRGRASTSIALGLTLAFGACTGEEAPRALDEPLVATPAVFKKGKLPGAEPDGQPLTEGPAVSFSITGRIQQGTAGLTIAGTANAETYAVGFRIADEGTGYWLAGIGAEDLFVPGQFGWGASFDLAFNLDPGPHDFIAVGFDKDGKAGKQTKQTLCVDSDLFDNGNTCNPTTKPPAAVAVLRWNTGANLDLSVLAPDFTRYDRTKFFQVQDAKIVAELKGDSSSACLADGRMSETFVWHEQPPKGIWYLYANLFDICGHAAVSYELTTYRRQDNGDGTFSLKEEKTFAGEFVRTQVGTTTTNPLYLTRIEFP